MSALPSDEVAQDYRDALDDLMNNDRYQIANLTMIAKENIEHAEAISRVLISHIKKVSESARQSRIDLTVTGYTYSQAPSSLCSRLSGEEHRIALYGVLWP